MKKLEWGLYKNGNAKVAINLINGTKIRETEDDEFDLAFAENIDFKITNRCSGIKNCGMCHEGSGPFGEHGDVLNLSFIDTLHPLQELACLSGDTMVHTEFGSKKIEELKIGDKIYDSEYKLRTVVNIQKNKKDVFLLKGSKGLKIKCSKDHPFISEEKQVKAEELHGKNIDLIKPINIEQDKKRPEIDLTKYAYERDITNRWSRSGKIFNDGKIKLNSSSPIINSKIKVDKDLMWLYGLFCAEGSRNNLTLSCCEGEMAYKAGCVWRKTFGIGGVITANIEKHSSQVYFSSKRLTDILFLEEFKVGKGARNKSLGYLYSIEDKELIRSALRGLFDGDGCVRQRKHKNGSTYYGISLKTTSPYIAYDTAFLLAKWFGIYATVYHGISPDRYIEGRLLKSSDYYSVEFYGQDKCKEFYPELEYVPKLVDETPNNKSKVKELIDTEEVGILYDITLDSGTHIFPVNGYFLTHNCGGGNILEYPDLLPLLNKLHERMVITNLTVNQYHFMENVNFLEELIDRELIKGIGVSLMSPSDGFILMIKQFPTAVIHTINGIIDLATLEKLYDKDLNILILGYKDLRRGHEYKETHGEEIDRKIKELSDNIMEVCKHFKHVAFDNLALEQLDMKSKIDPKRWEELYMGDEGTATFYIDGVTQTFAESSTAPLDERYPLMDSVDEMFKFIKERKKRVKK